MISWYNNSVKKRGDIQKQDIKKDDRISWQHKRSSIQKRIYNIEENGGKPQKIYIRPYYNLIGAKKKMEKSKEYEMYDNIVKNIVKKCGGFREKDITSDNHKNGFSIDLVTMKICG